ncbi:hypothetical protein OROGR_027178 [Orobanche gracilis]
MPCLYLSTNVNLEGLDIQPIFYATTKAVSAITGKPDTSYNGVAEWISSNIIWCELQRAGGIRRACGIGRHYEGGEEGADCNAGDDLAGIDSTTRHKLPIARARTAKTVELFRSTSELYRSTRSYSDMDGGVIDGPKLLILNSLKSWMKNWKKQDGDGRRNKRLKR